MPPARAIAVVLDVFQEREIGHIKGAGRQAWQRFFAHFFECGNGEQQATARAQIGHEFIDSLFEARLDVGNMVECFGADHAAQCAWLEAVRIEVCDFE